MVWLRNPPSTRISLPVTNELAFGLARKRAAPINSRASPNRPIGVWLQIALVRAVGEPSSLKRRLRFCSAGKKPGVIEFTRTPLDAHSRARNCVRFSTAALAAEYATTRDNGTWPDALALLIIDPRPRFPIGGPNAWHRSRTPPTRVR